MGSSDHVPWHTDSASAHKELFPITSSARCRCVGCDHVGGTTDTGFCVDQADTISRALGAGQAARIAHNSRMYTTIIQQKRHNLPSFSAWIPGDNPVILELIVPITVGLSANGRCPSVGRIHRGLRAFHVNITAEVWITMRAGQQIALTRLGPAA